MIISKYTINLIYIDVSNSLNVVCNLLTALHYEISLVCYINVVSIGNHSTDQNVITFT